MLGFQANGLLIRELNSELDYAIDFSKWLKSGDQLFSVEVTASGVTLGDNYINNQVLTLEDGQSTWEVAENHAVVLWLSGGSPGVDGKLRLNIVTENDRKREIVCEVVTRG